MLKLLKTLYDLRDSENIWYKIQDEHHRKGMKMTQFRYDSSIYKLMENGKLIGISGGYIDDMIRTRSAYFHELSRKTHQRFWIDE